MMISQAPTGTGSKPKILDAAREMFYRSGYLGTSVDDIIAGAKVSKSNFYYHFKSKEDLGLAVLSSRCGEFESVLAATLCNDGLTPKDRLTELIRRLSEIEDLAGCPFGNLVAEMSEHSERI